MLYTWLSLIFMMPGTYYTAAFVGIPVSLKKGQLYPIAVTVVCSLLWMLNHFLLPKDSILVDIAVYVSMYLLLYFCTERGQRSNAFLTLTLLLLAQLVGVFLLMGVILKIGEIMGLEITSINVINTPLHALGSLLGTVFLFPFLYLCARLIKKLISGSSSLPRLLSFLIIPISQLLLANTTIQYAYRYAQCIGISYYPGDVILVMIVSIAAEVAFVLLYRYFRRAELLKMSMEQARQQLDLQSSYYQELQKSILSVNQIRHDLNNQLQVAYVLLQQGQNAQVEKQLDLLRASIRQRVGTRYCGNMMVDAILTAKAEQCQQMGAETEISVFLPPQLPIENAHLCSLFSNLMDNSLQAIQKIRKGTLTLRAELHGTTLTVSCANPSLPPENKGKNQDLLRPHGLGLEILRHLAQIYHGRVTTNYAGGIFTTTVLLSLPESSEAPVQPPIMQ